MKVIIDKKLTAGEREKLLEKVQPKMKVLNARKYFGKIKLQEDPLKIQQEMRDE